MTKKQKFTQRVLRNGALFAGYLGGRYLLSQAAENPNFARWVPGALLVGGTLAASATDSILSELSTGAAVAAGVRTVNQITGDENLSGLGQAAYYSDGMQEIPPAPQLLLPDLGNTTVTATEVVEDATEEEYL